jgi:hypothetical protein
VTGSYVLTPSSALFGTGSSTDYTVSYANGTLLVDPKAITLVADPVSKIYGTTATFNGFRMVDGALIKSDGTNFDTMDSTGVGVSSTGASAAANVGTYSLEVTGALAILDGSAQSVASNYKIAYGTTLPNGLTVTPRPITITATTQTAKVYGQLKNLGTTGFTYIDPTLSATAVVPMGTAIVNGDTLSGATLSSAGAAGTAHAGVYAVGVSNALFSSGQGSNYAISYAPGTGALSVNQLAITVAANDVSKTYGQTANLSSSAFNVKVTDSTSSLFSKTYLPNGDTIGGVSLASEGAAAGAHRSGYIGVSSTLSADFASSGLYSINPTAATGGTFTSGDYAITYASTGRLNVAALALTYSVANASSTYGTLATTGAVTLTSQVLGDTVTGVVSVYNAANSQVTLASGTHAGSYSQKVTSLTGANAADYVVAGTGNADGVLTVLAKALRVSLTGVASQTYDGTTVISLAGATYVLTPADLVGSDGFTLTNTSSNGLLSQKDAGSRTVTASLNGGMFTTTGSTLLSDYMLPSFAAGTATVTPKALTATLAALNKTYDGSLTASPTLSIIAGGLVGSETVTATGAATFNSKDVLSANLVTLNSTVLSDGANGGLASNYSLASGQTVAASITAKALSATANAFNKAYDGSVTASPTLSIISGGLVGSETVTATGAATFNSKDVLSANLVTLNSTALSDGANGGLASNYSLASGQTVGASISRLASVTWTGAGDGVNWFDPANWGGAVPDLGNVANVVIPSGVNVIFDSATSVQSVQAGTVLVDSIGTSGALTIKAGTLNVASSLTLASLAQTGGRIEGQGSVTVDNFSQTGGALVTQGNFTVAKSASQSAPGTVAVGGAISMAQLTGDLNVVSLSGTKIDLRANTGAVNVVNLSTTGNLNINAYGSVVQASNGVISVAGLSTLNSAVGTPVLTGLGNNFKGQLLVNGKIINLGRAVLSGSPFNFVPSVPSALTNTNTSPPAPLVEASSALTGAGPVLLGSTAGALQLSLGNGVTLVDVNVSGVTITINDGSVSASFKAGASTKSGVASVVLAVVTLDGNGRAELGRSAIVSETPGKTTVGSVDAAPDGTVNGAVDVDVGAEPLGVIPQGVEFFVTERSGRNLGFLVELVGKDLYIRAKNDVASKLLVAERDVIISIALATARKQWDTSAINLSTIYLEASTPSVP